MAEFISRSIIMVSDNSNGGIKYLIEYNGQQHYQFKKMFHRDYNNFIINQHRDKLKIDYCNNNKLNLYIIKYDEDIND